MKFDPLSVVTQVNLSKGKFQNIGKCIMKDELKIGNFKMGIGIAEKKPQNKKGSLGW